MEDFEFEGPGDCELCQSMVGTLSSAPIEPLHPNCRCKSRPRCDNRYEYQGSSTRYGPNGECFIFNAEITVTCWDGSVAGGSFPIDMGCESEEGDVWDAIEAAMHPDVEALEAGCPDCSPPLVS